MVGKRKLLQTRVLAPVDTDFNNHNSYTAVDVNVTYLVRHQVLIELSMSVEHCCR